MPPFTPSQIAQWLPLHPMLICFCIYDNKAYFFFVAFHVRFLLHRCDLIWFVSSFVLYFFFCSFFIYMHTFEFPLLIFACRYSIFAIWIKLQFCRQNNWTLALQSLHFAHAILKLQIKFILYGEWHTSSRCSRFIVLCSPSAGCFLLLFLLLVSVLHLQVVHEMTWTSSARPLTSLTYVIIVCEFSSLSFSFRKAIRWIVLDFTVYILLAPFFFQSFCELFGGYFCHILLQIEEVNEKRHTHKKTTKCSAEDICEKQWQQWYRRATELSCKHTVWN